MIQSGILYGVGKKMRSAYNTGKVSEREILVCYNRNKAEADSFDPFGWSINDLLQESRATHNPLMRMKLEALIEDHRTKSVCSRNQNELSLKKLDYYRDSALGVGIRPLMSILDMLAVEGDVEAKILCLLLHIEFANLNAKKRTNLSKVIYRRKDILLQQVSDLLYDNEWRCGVSYNPGKNASHIVYVYLPDGTQLSWHSNDLETAYCYDEIDAEWDGRVCSTLEKLLSYAHRRFCIGSELVEYNLAS